MQTKEEKSFKQHQYYLTHKNESRKNGQKWRKENYDKYLESSLRYYYTHKDDKEEKERRRAYAQKIAPKQKKYLRNWKLQKIHGISLEIYNMMFEKQNGRCEICGEPPDRENLFVDHDHKTGKIRNLLCSSCNFAIGYFQDDPILLQKAKNYLEKWSR